MVNIAVEEGGPRHRDWCRGVRDQNLASSLVAGAHNGGAVEDESVILLILNFGGRGD